MAGVAAAPQRVPANYEDTFTLMPKQNIWPQNWKMEYDGVTLDVMQCTRKFGVNGAWATVTSCLYDGQGTCPLGDDGTEGLRDRLMKNCKTLRVTCGGHSMHRMLCTSRCRPIKVKVMQIMDTQVAFVQLTVECEATDGPQAVAADQESCLRHRPGRRDQVPCRRGNRQRRGVEHQRHSPEGHGGRRAAEDLRRGRTPD
jgi:hypothetical protein